VVRELVIAHGGSVSVSSAGVGEAAPSWSCCPWLRSC